MTRLRDILNPKKWVDYAQGNYYEHKIGFWRCQQKVYASVFPEEKLKDSKKWWERFIAERGISFTLVAGVPSVPKMSTVNAHLELIPFYFAEQAVIRSVKCPQCLINRKCVGPCGCEAPHVFMAPLNNCSKYEWGQFMDEKDYLDSRTTSGKKLVVVDLSRSI